MSKGCSEAMIGREEEPDSVTNFENSQFSRRDARRDDGGGKIPVTSLKSSVPRDETDDR